MLEFLVGPGDLGCCVQQAKIIVADPFLELLQMVSTFRQIFLQGGQVVISFTSL